MQPTNSLQSKKEKAFTLIELLVVIAIVGILAGLAVVNMSGATEAARIAKSKVFANSVNNSLLGNRISEWKLDEGSGTTTTDIIGTNSGTLVNFNFNSVSGWRSGSSCVSGGCLQFDGTDDVVSVGAGDNFDLTSAFSLGAWVKPNTIAAGARTILYRGTAATVGGYAINQEGGSFRGYFYDTAWKSTGLSTAINTDTWYYVLVSYDKSLLKLYIDGKLDKQTSFTTSVNVPSGAYTEIGAVSPTVQRFSGLIDEVRIYSAALTASAIRENYLAGLDNLLASNQISKKDYQQRLADLNSGIYTVSGK
jgi:prepilin-type N-terminal cleavage/methylation domain-containing protein